MRAWLDGRYDLVTSEEQLDELRRVLGYEHLRALINPAQARDFVENVDAMAIVAVDLPTLEVSPDPDDNVILATAVAGGADAVVSGDKGDVLSLGEVEGIPIITARPPLNTPGVTPRSSSAARIACVFPSPPGPITKSPARSPSATTCVSVRKPARNNSGNNNDLGIHGSLSRRTTRPSTATDLEWDNATSGTPVTAREL